MKSLTCTSCGAPLAPAPGAAHVTCAHCGSRVALDPAPAPAPPARRTSCAALGCAALLTAALAVPALVTALRPLAPAPATWTWLGQHEALLADVDGDGVRDVVGRARSDAPDQPVAVAAWSGRDGAPLWRAEPFGPQSETHGALLGLVGEVVILGLPSGELRAHSVRDGAIRWRAAAPERAEGLCAPSPGVVVLLLAGGGRAAHALADGAPVRVGPACDPLPHDRRAWVDTTSLPDDAHLRPALALEVPGSAVLVGSRREGTPVPLVGLRRPGGAGDWTAELAGASPLTSRLPWPALAAVDEVRVYAAWEPEGDGPDHVVAFDLAGRRLWDVALPGDAGAKTLQAADGRVLVGAWGALLVLDGAEGSVLYRL